MDTKSSLPQSIDNYSCGWAPVGDTLIKYLGKKRPAKNDRECQKNKVNTDGKQISQSAVSLTGKKRKDNVQLNGIFLVSKPNGFYAGSCKIYQILS